MFDQVQSYQGNGTKTDAGKETLAQVLGDIDTCVRLAMAERVRAAVRREEPELAHGATFGNVRDHLKQHYGVSDETIYELRQSIIAGAVRVVDAAVADHKQPLSYSVVRRLQNGDWLR